MINKAILVGRLTKDPELKQTQSGISVVSFTVACDRPYQQDGERKADFINCIAWRQTADFVGKYFKKGNAIGIDGSIQTRKYQDKNGNNRIAFEVVCDRVSFVESKKNKETNEQSKESEDYEELTEDTDLPF